MTLVEILEKSLSFERQLTSTEEAKVVDHLVHKWGALAPVQLYSHRVYPTCSSGWMHRTPQALPRTVAIR